MLKEDLSKLKQLIDRVRVRLGSKVGFEQTHVYPFRRMSFADTCFACIGKERCDWIDFYFCKMTHATIHQQIDLDQRNLYVIERVYYEELWNQNAGENTERFDPKSVQGHDYHAHKLAEACTYRHLNPS